MQYELPKGLTQYYMQIKIEDKLDTLFSFLRTHMKTKSLVFFSSIKQVLEAFYLGSYVSRLDLPTRHLES